MAFAGGPCRRPTSLWDTAPGAAGHGRLSLSGSGTHEFRPHDTPSPTTAGAAEPQAKRPMLERVVDTMGLEMQQKFDNMQLEWKQQLQRDREERQQEQQQAQQEV